MFYELSLVATITVSTPVSCYYVTSFNYGGKKARNIGLNCRCHQSNIMPDSIFYDSMGWGMACFCFFLFAFLGVVIAVFLSIKDMDSVLSLQHEWV